MTVSYSKIVGNILKVLPKRYQIIMTRRFGLAGKKPETLESIGRSYKITRERVRQIEEAALKQIRNAGAPEGLSDSLNHFREHLDSFGGLRRENELFAELAGSSRYFSRLSFLLKVAGQFERIPEDNRFHTFWMSDKTNLERTKMAIGTLIKKLEEKAVPHSENELRELSQKEIPQALGEDIDESALQSYLAISKEVCRGPFGHFGLRHWPEINPRGIKDKAYLIFKREGKPLHFQDVCGHINKTDFPMVHLGAWRRKSKDSPLKKLIARKTNPQTVHNELIKDPRFVLVGRGIYALKEWGYVPGVVKDVIKKVLTEAGQPLHRDEIITKVLNQRVVKPGTVLCNLQDKKCFARLGDGRYTVVA